VFFGSPKGAEDSSVTPRLFPAFALIASFTSPAFAQTAPHQHDHPTAASSGAVIDVPAAATDAVATVDRFSAALSAGDLAKAGNELDPNVLILESGGAERSAAEYLGGHAKSDAEFLKSAHQQLRRRSAHVSGDFAWVASESELHLEKDGKPVTVLSTETMLLQRRAAEWTIVHIHWSSRKKDPSAAH
jgi:ketosteroid isomerase-like protein